MTKVTLDRETFKALASDTRLDILKSLDGRHMSLKEICTATKLNKATLHEHLVKLNEAGLIKKNERESHKWIYYKLTWKGECLLHPENTRIVVLFTTTFIALWIGIVQFMQYLKGTAMNLGYNILTVGNDAILTKGGDALIDAESFKAAHVYYSGTPDILNVLMKKNYWTYNSSSIPLGKDLTFLRISDAPDVLPKGTHYVADKSEGVIQAVYQDPTLLYIAIACLTVFTIVLCISLWRLWENKTQKI